MKKNIFINNKQELVITLTRICSLLMESGHDVQAEAIKKPLKYLQQDQNPEFLRTLKTVDIWGGSGAAWEVGIFISEDSEREFQKMFILLAEQLKNTGIDFKAANQIASIFKRELGGT